MAKNPPPADGHRNGAARDRRNVEQRHDQWIKRDHATGHFVDSKTDGKPLKGSRREILFPTESTAIDHKKIDRAVERVVSRKK